jgi:hypothetical protein
MTAAYMFVLRPTKKTFKTVCPACAERGEVLDICSTCHGSAIRKQSINQYYVSDKPIKINHIDRDPKTGILRYWENSSEFYYETAYHSLNPHVPEVPYGIHFCHNDMLSAKRECERINNYLNKNAAEALETIKFNF